MRAALNFLGAVLLVSGTILFLVFAVFVAQ